MHSQNPRIAQPVDQTTAAANLHNFDAEQGLLGAILYDNETLARIGDHLQPHHFYDPTHGRIFQVCRAHIKRGKLADAITLREEFSRDGGLAEIGGASYLLTLVQNAARMTSHAVDYADLVVNLAERRQVLANADAMRAAALAGGDVGAVLREMETSARPANRYPVEWGAEITPRHDEWLVQDILPSTGLACVYGPPGSGKTFFVIDFAMAIATGREVLGATTQHTGVMLVAAEAANGSRKRIQACRLSGAITGDVPLALIDAAPDLGSPDSPGVDRLIGTVNGAGREFEARGAKCKMLVFDTMARLTPGMDENRSDDMGRAVAAWQRIGRETGTLILVVCHTGKDVTRGVRGHSSLLGAADAMIEVGGDTDARTLTLTKSKESDTGRVWGFRLGKVRLGSDENGDEISSCAVFYEDAPPASTAKQAPLTAPEKHVVNAIRALITDTGGDVPCPTLRCPAGVRVVRVDAVRTKARDLGISDAGAKDPDEAVRRAVSRALEKLTAKRIVFKKGDVVWLARS